MIKIGIITPTYNRPQLLLRLHKSLVRTGEGFDWIHCVVDDGSSESYAEVLEQCEAESGRLRYKRIENSGPLVARNYAIEYSIDEGCTHVCFVDDDDWLLPDAFENIRSRIGEFPRQKFFSFRALKANKHNQPPYNQAKILSYRNDILPGSLLGSDNFSIIATDLIGEKRFSILGRNQREWTFFIKIFSDHDSVVACPEFVKQREYRNDGLTLSGQNSRRSSSSVFNNLSRAFFKWKLNPTHPALIKKLLVQIGLFPARIVMTLVDKRFSQ